MFLKQQTALRNISVSSPICLVPSESSLRIRDFISNIGKQSILVQYFDCYYFYSVFKVPHVREGAVENSTENCSGEL